MSLIFPRLDRQAALRFVGERRHEALVDIAGHLPHRFESVTFPPIGGERVDETRLAALRESMLELAAEHGMPGEASRDTLKRFEGKASRLVREALPMTPHEASDYDVWTNITVSWLLDVAIWRFGPSTGDNRFLGDLNRNTFRRMWWRAEVLGPEVDLEELGEDELTAIMERPSLFADRRVARAIAVEFLRRVEGDADVRRQELMRQGTKRLLRLTPFVSFTSLTDEDVRRLVRDVFDAADAGIQGRAAPGPTVPHHKVPVASPEIRILTQVDIGLGEGIADTAVVDPPEDLAEVKRAAIDIAAKTGRVTNTALRELVHITPEQARQVFNILLDEGALVRRGVKRGTHYVLPEQALDQSAEARPVPPNALTPAPSDRHEDPGANSTRVAGGRSQGADPSTTARSDALRRFLRRGR